MKLKKFALTLTLACLSVPTFAQILEHKKETILVKFKSDVTKEKISKKLSKFMALSERKITGSDIHVVRLPPGVSEKFAADSMKADAEVEFAELDQLVPLDSITPTDPRFNNQWGLHKIQAPEAWDITTGSSSITIAILDTGVEVNHPDLKANIVPGYNTVSDNTDIVPTHSHGTRVAGVAAAVGNNNIGVAGVCWNCKIMPMKVSNLSSGAAYWSDIAEAIIWAANNGARVANASYACWESYSVISAAAYMKSKGGVFVASAGNDAKTYNSPAFPKDLLVVSGTTSSDALYSWSSRGTILTNSAPGNVYTTTMGGGYTSTSGTSFAAPLTAGVAALVLSKNPQLTGDQVMDIIKNGADDLGDPGYDPKYGNGRLNAFRAVELAGQPQIVNGVCGKSHGKTFTTAPTLELCAAGTASRVTLSKNTFKWTCSGQVGGSTVNCSANYEAPDTIAPTAPVNLKATLSVISKTAPAPSVNLSWGAATDNVGVKSYIVLRNGKEIGSSRSLTFEDKTVVKGTKYTYTVIAVDGALNQSVASNTAGVVVR